jgi:hypothetical protein
VGRYEIGAEQRARLAVIGCCYAPRWAGGHLIGGLSRASCMQPRLRDGSAGMCEAAIAATHSGDDPMGAGLGRVDERANFTKIWPSLAQCLLLVAGTVGSMMDKAGWAKAD